MDEEQPGSSDPTLYTFSPEAQQAKITSLQQRVKELEGKRRPPVLAGPDDGAGQAVPEARTAEELEELVKWVDWLLKRYAAASDWLRPCWWRHGFVVEELSALRTAWRGVYQAEETPEPKAALEWHENADKCRERIRQAIGTGPGCTTVSHRPEQPVAREPRWTEEHDALLAAIRALAPGAELGSGDEHSVPGAGEHDEVPSEDLFRAPRTRFEIGPTGTGGEAEPGKNGPGSAEQRGGIA